MIQITVIFIFLSISNSPNNAIYRLLQNAHSRSAPDPAGTCRTKGTGKAAAATARVTRSKAAGTTATTVRAPAAIRTTTSKATARAIRAVALVTATATKTDSGITLVVTTRTGVRVKDTVHRVEATRSTVVTRQARATAPQTNLVTRGTARRAGGTRAAGTTATSRPRGRAAGTRAPAKAARGTNTAAPDY